ncbi:MmgE/PrpD family protein [Phreatobacter sp.]|uniref:MmgE/PrpD family protein n=1 Tax=Phreatobacter sp. TaxID=1966341 RepID=UPI003F72F275
MAIVTPGVKTATELAAEPRTNWLGTFCSFAAGLSFHDLPEEVVARAKQVIYDCIGAISAGMAEPEMRALADRLARLDGAGDTPVIGGSGRLSASNAALLAGTAGTMLEIDEGNQYARGHPGIHVVPAALIMAARLGASGEDLITAVVLGYEIGARIGIASKLVVTMHPHGTWGTVGAALAVARLHELDAGSMAEVINIASSLGLATSRKTMLEGATVRNSYAGLSNKLGLLAFELTGAGFSGEIDGVATVYGTVAATDFRPGEMTADLGTRWEIARNYFKRHAACRYTHAALDALGEILAKIGPVDPRHVLGIEVETYVWAAQLDDPDPKSMLAAKFSLPFALATTLVNGSASIEAFRDAARGDRVTRALASRVTVTEDPALTAMLPAARPARVTMRLADGRSFTALATTNRGDTEDPYPVSEVEAKFIEITTPVWGETGARRVIAAVNALDTDMDPRRLLALATV